MDKAFFSKEYFLVPGEADAQRELPLTELARHVIEVASLHANMLGFGHADMEPDHIGWVLSRLSFEMRRFPALNRTYTLTTWIESWTRHFSERCFEVTDADGSVLGHVRSVWMLIDTESRQGATTDSLVCDPAIVGPRQCPIARMSRIPVIGRGDEGVECRDYTYLYTDIDFYRHVNTVKHIRTLVDSYTMEVMDRCRITRADIAFMREGHCGEHVSILRRGDVQRVVADDGTPLLAARMVMSPR